MHENSWLYSFGHRSPPVIPAAPVTAGEAESLELPALAALGDGRRYLETTWPTDSRKQPVGWATGELTIRA